MSEVPLYVDVAPFRGRDGSAFVAASPSLHSGISHDPCWDWLLTQVSNTRWKWRHLGLSSTSIAPHRGGRGGGQRVWTRPRFRGVCPVQGEKHAHSIPAYLFNTDGPRHH